MALALALNGCAVRLLEVDQVKYYPPATGTPIRSDAGLTYLQKSRTATVQGTKVFLLNMNIDPSVISGLGLKADACVQAVKLPTGEMLGDLLNIPCPADSALATADQIAFTLGYDDAGNNVFKVKSDSSAYWGQGQADPTAKTSLVQALCTGDYASQCEVGVVGGYFYDIAAKK